MFCNGKCEKCRLNYSKMMENVVTNKVEEVKQCVFLHLMESQIRIELALIRIQKTMEGSRNQKANDDHKASTIVATGFLGLMHAFREDETKFKNILSLLESVNQPLGLKEK
jgi:uncharacterized protein YjcR